MFQNHFMFDDLKQYINNRIAYAKLEVVDSVSNMISAGIFGILIGMIIMMLLFVGSLSIGFLFGRWFENNAIGFLFVMGIYTVIFILFYIFRKKIILYITNKVIVAAMDAIENIEDNQRNG